MIFMLLGKGNSESWVEFKGMSFLLVKGKVGWIWEAWLTRDIVALVRERNEVYVGFLRSG